MKSLTELEREIHDESIAVWHRLHENPELSMEEYQTADYIQSQLAEKTGLAVRRVGKTGIWAELAGTAACDGPERILVLRGDMDALPIQEKTDLPYCSKIPGVMHACGHDMHTTALLASARILESFRDRIAGKIWFFFQPGEEKMAGAKTFLEDPDIDFDRVTQAIGIHAAGNVEVGKIRLKNGPILASSDELHFRLHGIGGHAAYPQNTHDTIVAAAYLIAQLHTLVSREVSPLDSAVLTIGKIMGGTKDNIIASEVTIDGTLRTLNQKTREDMQAAIRRICDGVETALRVDIDLEISQGTKPLLNCEGTVNLAKNAALKLLGNDSVVWAETPGMASEDFGYFLERVPGAFVFIGTQTPGKPPAAGHTPEFYTDPDAVRVASLILSGTALEYFSVEYF